MSERTSKRIAAIAAKVLKLPPRYGSVEIIVHATDRDGRNHVVWSPIEWSEIRALAASKPKGKAHKVV